MRIGAYWCVVNSVFTHCGPQYAKVRFSRAPVRRIGALPHTLTTVSQIKLFATRNTDFMVTDGSWLDCPLGIVLYFRLLQI